MLCNSGVPLVPDCLYQVSGMAYLFGPCMSVFTAMPRPGYLLRMILPVKTQCRRHRRVMEVILLKQKQIKCPYCHAHASLRPASLVYGSTPQTRKMGSLYLAASQAGTGCTPDPHRPVFRIYVRASHFPLSAGSGVHIRACCLNGGEA